jgi:hypothetical protein
MCDINMTKISEIILNKIRFPWVMLLILILKII